MVEGFLRGGPVRRRRAPLPRRSSLRTRATSTRGRSRAAPSSALAAAAATIERVVLLGPSHFVPIRGLALPGRFPVRHAPRRGEGGAGGRSAPRSGCRRSGSFPRPTSREHSLEVELPFLQVLLGDFELVPLVAGEATSEEMAEVLERLWGGAGDADRHQLRPLALSRLRRGAAGGPRTADAILALDGPLDSRQACGAVPINGLLEVARRRGLIPELLDLRNSADTAGDPVPGGGLWSLRFP